MVLALIGPHPESASLHLHPYISKFRYVPQYHPSRNPACESQRLRREFYNEFEYEDRRYSSFEEPLVDQDHPWIEIRSVLVRCPKTRREVQANAIYIEILGVGIIYKVTDCSKYFYYYYIGYYINNSETSQSVQNCKRKMIINMKINNVGKVSLSTHY